MPKKEVLPHPGFSRLLQTDDGSTKVAWEGNRPRGSLERAGCVRGWRTAWPGEQEATQALGEGRRVHPDRSAKQHKAEVAASTGQ